jgi:uncharacterized protein (TIGR03437 family)
MGDGGLATSALIGTSQGIALDSAGNIYFLDTSSPRVRKVSTAGIINTAAGNGTLGFGNIGDGGPATSAGLNPSALPFFQGVALDNAGNLYIADGGNHRVRKVNSSGIISTFAGNGSLGSSGDGGPAANAGIVLPSGLVSDSAGNLYIGDVGGARIRKVAANGNISTIVGTGTPGFSGDGGPAVSAQTFGPQGLALDAQGNLYFSEFGSAPRVRKVDTNGIITTVAGNGSPGFSGDGGPAINAQLGASVAGVVIDGAGNLYIADIANFRVRKVDSAGNITTIAGIGLAVPSSGNGDGGIPTSAHVNPIGLALGPSGNLYISDGAAIREINFSAAPPGLSPSAFSLYFADSARFSQPKSQSLTIASAGPALSFTASATTSSGGNWLIAPPGTLTTPYEMTVSIVGGLLGAGTYTGTLTFTPAISSLPPVNVSVTVVISATVPATPVITDVVNGASFQPGYALGSLTTIKGTNLAPKTDDWSSLLASGHLPTSLDGVVVTFNGYPGFVSYISPTQINVVAPWNQNAACCTVLVTNNGAVSSFFSVQGSPSSPAFFTWPGNQVVATHQDYSFAVKAGTFAAFTTVAAKPGDVLVLWGTGFGPTTPAALDGAVIPSTPTYSTSTLPTVTVNNIAATVYGAALTSGYAGLYQVAIQVPATLADGDWPIQASVGGVQSASGVILSVKH